MNNQKRSSVRTILAVLLPVALIVGGALGCQKPDNRSSEGTTTQTSSIQKIAGRVPVAQAAPEQAAPEQGMPGQGTPAQADPGMNPAQDAGAMNWFGGPTYTGEPALEATAALIKAGGGKENFSFNVALISMLGETKVNAEVAKLTKQYGVVQVKTFMDGMDFAVNDGIKKMKAAGMRLPEPPADLRGAKLAKALIQAGTAPDGAFWAGYLFDKALSHEIHMATMVDFDAKAGHAADGTTHRILNQAMYDVAQELGMKNVKLASDH